MSRVGGSRTAARVVGWIFFIVYIAALVYFLFFAEGYGRVIDGAMHYNLEPFREEIERFLIHYDVLGWQAVVLNIVEMSSGLCRSVFPAFAECERAAASYGIAADI